MHQLVRLSVYNWLRDHQQWNVWVSRILTRLVEVIPYGGHDKRDAWVAHLPYAIHVVDLPKMYEVEGRISLLD